MQMLYDTRSVHPLDRYDYYQAASATELAPVAVDGRAPGRLLAVMSTARIGDLELEHVTWSADAQLVTRRTQRLIQARDPECYRVFLSASGVMIGEQEGRPVPLRANDMALFDLSSPCDSTHGMEPTQMRAVMLSIPRSQVPVPHADVRPLTSTHVPRTLPGRSLIAQFLLGLDPALPAPNPTLEDVLRESVTGLIRVWLGQPSWISPRTRQTLWIAHLSNLIRRRLGDPGLNVEQLAKAANLSPRSLHLLFRDSGLTPMRLVKQLRLSECHRSLLDPAMADTPIKNLIAARGYLRPDQFARDFRQQFGISASQVRASAHPVSSHVVRSVRRHRPMGGRHSDPAPGSRRHAADHPPGPRQRRRHVRPAALAGSARAAQRAVPDTTDPACRFQRPLRRPEIRTRSVARRRRPPV